MDSTQYAAAVADKTLDALDKAGISVASAARESGIPRSTLDRKFNSGKGIQALTVRELYELARVANTTPHELARTYSLEPLKAAA